ncbi:MAG TPA: saccharopine dehydrogenase NADP-binding domain-containing protein [Ktedonobacteraceae bacterium]|nr:saccharopine dehydrogenase NADP-binding domain-containing protein [Ktedonobacteraceae bacterium]
MKVVVLGGCGSMGSETTRDLATTSDFEEITIADLNVARAQGLADELNAITGHGHVRAVQLDASDEEALRAVMRGQDVIVNTMTYHFGLLATRAAIHTGVSYVDLGGLHNTPRQLALDEEARAEGVTIVLGCGATPGVTNILARRGANDLDSVDAIHICFASHRSIAPSPGLLDTIIDEFSPEASRFYFEDGQLVEVQPFDGARTIPFQTPIGEQEVYFVPHSETHTLPRFIGKGLRRVDVRGAWRPETMQALRLFLEYRFITSDAVQVNGTTLRAKEFLRAHLLREEANGHASDVGEWAFLLYVEVKGTKAGYDARRIYRTSHPGMNTWGKQATAKMTGIPASIAAQLLAHHEAQGIGVLAPEAAFEPTRFIAELARRDIRVEECINEYGIIDEKPADALSYSAERAVVRLTSNETVSKP